MIDTLIYIISFLAVLSIVVVVHEGGHFCMARFCGVKVTDFSLGFGKELWGRVDKHGTRWKLCAIPMGGYVKMLGDEDAASAKTSKKGIAKKDLKHMFMAQPIWKRASIIFAGPAMNYIFAIVVLASILFAVGEVSVPPVVGQVLDGSAAQEAGLLKGDRIVSINNKKIAGYRDIMRTVQLTEYGKSLHIVFDRDGEKQVLDVMPKFAEGTDIPKLGIAATNEYEVVERNFGVVGALGRASYLAYETTEDTIRYLGQVLFKKRSANDMRGPIGIAEASGDALKGGVLSFILFLTYISIAIGFMNLLPIPILDGGHLMFYAVEAVRGKPLTEKTQNAFLWGGMGLLMALMAFTLFLDIPRVIGRMF